MKKIANLIVFEEDVYNSMFDVMFADLLRQKDSFKIIERPASIEWGIHPRLFNKLNQLSFGKLFLKYYLLPRKVKELAKDYDEIRVLFNDSGLRKPEYPVYLFNYLKKKYPVTFYLFYTDSYDRLGVTKNANKLKELGIFDYVYTFDQQDAEKYHMAHAFTPYSKLDLEVVPIKTDLYALGRGDARTYQLYQIWEAARKNDITLRFDLVNGGAFYDFFEGDGQISIYNRFLEYKTSLEHASSCRCIVDITTKGQTGLTLRPYEAVVYNKKLLTNNKSIFDFKYYNPSFMQYFEKVEDIDWEWVKKGVIVDYHYQGDFSPLHLFEKD